MELSRFQNNANFSVFLYSELGQKFISKYDILRQKFDTNADFKLRYELISMRSAGQLYRNNNYQDHEAKQDSIYQLHEAHLIEIFETIGYPTEQIVG